MAADNDTSDEQEVETAVVTTVYTIRSRESRESSWWWPISIITLLGVAMNSFGTDIFATIDPYWTDQIDVAILSSIAVALLGIILAHRLFFAKPTTKTIDLTLQILPLGVQRSRTITHDNSQTTNTHHYPLLPIGSIKDCILLEHVGAFSVSTHVMLRLQNSNNYSMKPTKNAAKGMVAAFPDVTLTFDQCHSLVEQITRALEQVQ